MSTTLTDAPFAEQLKQATKQAHTLTENLSFIQSYLRGMIDRKSYLQLIKRLHAVYLEMEHQFTFHQEHPLVREIYRPEIFRASSLEQDIHFFQEPSFIRNFSFTSKATHAYTKRIKEVASDAPHLLIAHAYVRYLGDLSGGRILKRITQRSLKLDTSGGLAFYEFPQVENLDLYKRDFKTMLNSLTLSPLQQYEILDEAVYVFTLNQQLFKEIEGNNLKAILKFASSLIGSSPLARSA